MKKLIAIFVLFISSNVFAGEITPFTEARLNQLQADNAAVLIDINATWCPTCRKQGEIIDQYLQANPESNLTVLKVDYDTQKQWVKHFNAVRQSTLVVFQGNKEMGRVIAETNKQKLFDLFAKVK